jgi:3-phenylpropionate/trans-cinnamate dioxygenase ferredoxin subunit
VTFQRACALTDIAVGAAAPVEIDGIEVAIVRCDDDAVFAVRDECSHASIPLSEGEVDAADCEIECWLHGSRFDLRTGEPTGLPAYEPVPVYPCKVDGDDVVVDVENPLNQAALA